jgi:hypothetical protein
MRGCILPVKEWRKVVVTMIALVASAASPLGAQSRKLRVESTEGEPIVYAIVTLEGATGQITDEKGELSIGAGRSKTMSVDVRRIGYAPWFGKIDCPDTAATLRVSMTRISQSLAEVRVTEKAKAPIYLQPFYDRWMMRQKGLLSATFIGPEEIEFRHPGQITQMLNGLNGVELKHGPGGWLAAYTGNFTCPMAIVIDGIQKCPPGGCTGGNAGVTFGKRALPPPIWIDDLVDAASVAGIEVYTRGGNMPVSLQVNDTACGVIAIWTGSRKP